MYLLFFSHRMSCKISEKAMTLAEVMFATAILSVVFVTMIGTLTGGLEALQKSSNYNQACMIAQKTIEIYKGSDYTSLAGTKTWADGPFKVTTVIIQGTYGLYSYKKLIVSVDNKDYVPKKESIKKVVSVNMETLLIDKQ